ncbi:MAG: sulfatase-like hydrolase/transferase, partial [Rhizobiales bacterium]|nr:sulfatase-like hydrolase/transferase [Hyphomicrobiales bacterium]
MNILFITADQWRGECLSLRDHPHVKTPNLDALAADGIAFTRHYAQASPCGPSRACLYTGMYMQNHRSLLNGTPIDARHTNVAIEARKAGYEPALFGYTDVSLDPRQLENEAHVPGGYEGVLPGMEPVAHLDSEGEPWLDDLKRKGYDNVPDHAAQMLKSASPSEGGKGKTFAPARFKAEDSSSAFLVDEAIKYTAQDHDKPWFVHMSFLSPHPPYIAPEPYNSMYDADDMPQPVRCETAEEEAAQHP